MLQAIAIQAQHRLDGWVAQAILIPAAGLRFGRTISAEHPRSQWRIQTDPGRILPGVWDDHLDNPWALRHSSGVVTRVTMDPTGFQITDAEYLDIVATGELPRNVTLRYQRALEYRNAVLVGKRAGMGAPAGRVLLRAAYGDTTLDRLRTVVGQFEHAVESGNTSFLLANTPRVARAKAAGPWRTSRDLPGAVDLPAVEPAAVHVEPVVPEAFVKPVEPAAVAIDPVKPVKIGERLIRPNGTTYIARKIEGGDAGLSDVEMYRRIVGQGQNVLLFGVPGTGKTAALDCAFPGMVTMLGTSDTEASDFLGQYVQVAPGEYIWQDGPLLQAMSAGVPLLIDEVGLVDTRALSVVYSVMDGRSEVNVTMNPQRGTVHAKPGFIVLGATNPDAPGVRLSEALLSRFNLTVEVSTDFAAARLMGINERMVDAAEHMDTLRASGELSWAPQFRELLSFQAVENNLGLVLALRNIINQAPAIEREVVTAKLRERFGDLPAAKRIIKPLGV